MTYVFDLDGTLCETVGVEYAAAVPYPERIEIVNQLYDDGHTILIDSARGSVTGRNWLRLTRAQLDSWGVKYHDVRTGIKWYGDVYVDDKGADPESFFACP